MAPKPADHDIADLTIESVGVRGDGIAWYRGEEIYVPFTAPGDRLRAVLGPRCGDGRSARIADLTAPGERAPAACPHFGTCGGCALQHLMPNAYADAKLGVLLSALAQHGIDAADVAPLRRLAPGTRRRARLSLGRPRNPAARALVGFNRRASHQIVDMRACAILHPALAALVMPLRRCVPQLLAPGTAGAATITLAAAGIDVLLDLPAAPDLTGVETLADFAATEDLARLAWRTPETNDPVPAAIRRPVQANFAGVPVDLPYDVFLQASAEADSVLTDAVLAGLGEPRRIVDLFAGIGTFTFALAQRGKVLAVEASAPALTALATAARRAGLENRIGTLRRDLEQRPMQPDELGDADAVVFDPPRAGAKSQSRALAGSSVPVIIAVSCNPATFARDARTLIDGGYRLIGIQPFDTFVWSPHLELVAAFERC